jgi:hypothetical protein
MSGATTEVSNAQLNQMNQVLYDLKKTKPRQRAPVFSIPDIVQEWHQQVDPLATTEQVTAILEQGASTGFFIVKQCPNGALAYGFNANMLQSNPQNKFILFDQSDLACEAPCNKRVYPTCVFKTPVPSNCCFTQWKGTVAGGSLGECGASPSTMLFMCSGQKTLFC